MAVSDDFIFFYNKAKKVLIIEEAIIIDQVYNFLILLVFN